MFSPMLAAPNPAVDMPLHFHYFPSFYNPPEIHFSLLIRYFQNHQFLSATQF